MTRLPILATLLVGGVAGSRTVLFDGASSHSKPNTAPWGWFYLSLPPKARLTGPGSDGGVTLDTTADRKVQAGFGKEVTTKLDRTRGYEATWRLRLIKESHAADSQRAGLSVFVLGDDREGVEIAYWDDRIFVYNDDKRFTPGEHSTIDTHVMRTYRLAVSGDRYSLTVDGTVRLRGKLRNYSWFGFPYSRPNSIWYGDDTRRAESASEWAYFALDAR